jgi:hypothetical protein
MIRMGNNRSVNNEVHVEIAQKHKQQQQQF